MENIEDDFDDQAHNKFLRELKNLSGKSEKVRRERTVRVNSDAKPSFKFGNILSKIGDQNLSVASRDLKSLPKPLEKPEAKRLKRAAGFEELAVEVNRWEGVVEQRRKADQLVFPLKKADVRIITTERNYKPPMKTDLEKEIYQLMDGAKLVENDQDTEEDKEIRKAMTLEEIRLKSKENWRARILRQRILKKASMLNQSKSRRYRQILRRDRVRSKREEFERLKTSDPEGALEVLKQIEQTRLTERMTLRHKNSKWLSGQGSRAGRDFVARDMLKENTELRKELLKKLSAPEEEISDDADSKSDVEEDLKVDSENKEENDDFSSYRKTWVEFYKKKLEEREIGGVGVGEAEVAKSGSSVNGVECRGANSVLDNGGESIDEEIVGGNVLNGSGMCERERKDEVDVNSNVMKDDDVRWLNAKRGGIKESEDVDEDEKKVKGMMGKVNGIRKGIKSKMGVEGEIQKDKLRKIKNGRVVKVKRGEMANKKVNVMIDNDMSPLNQLKDSNISDVVKARNGKLVEQSLKKEDNKSSWVIEERNTPENVMKSDNLKQNDKVTRKIKMKNGGKIVDGSDRVMVGGWKVNEAAKSNNLKQNKSNRVIAKGWKISDVVDSDNMKQNNKSDREMGNGWQVRKVVDSDNLKQKGTKKLKKTKKGSNKLVNGSDKAISKSNKVMVKGWEVSDVADSLFLDDLFHKAEERVIKRVSESINKFKSDLSEHDIGDTGVDSSDKSDKITNGVEMEFDFRAKDTDTNLDERVTSARTLDSQHVLSNGVPMETNIAMATKILEKDDTQTSKPDSSKSLVSLDHDEVVQIKSRKMGNSRPDYSYLKRKLEEGSDSDGEAEAELQDIFDEEDMTENIQEFKAAKKAAEEAAQPKDVSVFQQGWGGWTGPGIAKKRNKSNKYRIKAPKAKPNKYSRVGHVIYNEKSDVHENIRKTMVSDLPHPFTSVADFESSIRQSTSRKFIPETAHKKLIAPPIITKMGTVIPPMDEEALLSHSKKNRKASKLEARLTEKLKGRKRSQKTAQKSHKKNKVKSLVLD